MRKILTIIILLFAAKLVAQPINNEWIDYSKTYYKFKVGKTGLYRIRQTDLPAALQTTDANQFQLWRNGKQVTLYTSVANAVLSSTDYIEFWGERNDGTADKYLYRNANFQVSDKVSLQTDTAAFFLTVNAVVANNLRYTNGINDVASNTLPADAYFMYNYRINFTDIINRGFAENAGENVYSSSYDIGEFWSSREIQVASPFTVSLPNLYAANVTAAASITSAFAANAKKNRKVQLRLNNALLIDQSLNGFTTTTASNANVSLSGLTNTTDNFNLKIVTSDNFDRVVCAYIDLKYPRQFNFGGTTNFSFTLAASPNGNFLNITNFSAGSAIPVLYNITNNIRYTANTATAGVLRFALPVSTTETNFVLVSEDASNITYANSFLQRNFINYATTANQGDFLIVTNKLLMTGTNPVEQYRQYRASSAGGSYNAKVFDIDELVDQFAYGIKKHPLSIKNFVRHAKATFGKQPSFIFLIGKGVSYDAYRSHESSPFADRLNLVPTWGWPASDNLLVSADFSPVPSINVGRLSVAGTQELSNYLQKVKDYELQATSTNQTISSKAWMKQMVHVVGAEDASLDALITYYLKNYENSVRDTLMGATVTNFNKTSTAAIATTSTQMSNLFTNGISMLSYFGHSAAAALSYNLNDPQDYNNTGKYPMFLVNGCSAGNFFDFDTTRTFLISSLAEKFVSAQNRGAIGFMGSTHFGLTTYLDIYSNGFYKSLTNAGYGKPITKNINDGIAALQKISSNFSDYFPRIHAEQSVLNGDPSIVIYAAAKPDFVVEDPQVIINPAVLSVNDNQFTVKAYLYNVGKATGDSVNVLVKRQYPDGSVQTIYNQRIKSVRYIDSISLTVPIIGTRDKGNNAIIVSIDSDNKYDEQDEVNNSITKLFVIFDDAVTTVYPLNHAIINKPNIKLIASTANPLSTQRNYVVDIDTTELFNSSFKVTKNLVSVGGALELDPGFSFKDSTVYYWRVAQVPASGSYVYTKSSFIYLANATSLGFNQSHVYQQTHSTVNKISIDTVKHQFNFNPNPTKITVRNAVYPYGSDAEINYSVAINDKINPEIKGASYRPSNITFNVFDSVSLKAKLNANPGAGQYGSLAVQGGANSGREYDFAFATNNATDRKKAMDFMDNIIPSGAYVVVRSMIIDFFGYDFANDLKQDESVYGTGNSLYHRLKNAGFADIDSFNRPRSFVFIYRKGGSGFVPLYKFSVDKYDKVVLDATVTPLHSSGTILSPLFGKAQQWKQLVFAGTRTDASDIVKVQVLGTKVNAKVADTLFTVNETQTTVDLSSVNATTYPYLQLYVTLTDTVKLSPYQFKYWRFLYNPIPEGAIAPNIQYTFKDTLEVGENLNVGLAFKNISDVAFPDSILVKMQVVDNNNTTTTLPATKLKKIISGDTAMVVATINTKNFIGTNTLFVDVNPENTQPEQYHFNNFVYKNFVVKNDIIKPLLDVTFDGVHILNNDIVAAKPVIHIKLKDESMHQALDDTSLMTVQLRFPDNSLRRYRFNTDTLRFTAANLASGENAATIDFTPYLLLDGKYELIVTGKDKTGNTSGSQEYRVTFTVYNKAMISNVFNYPNPFTTSTAFAFTLTGTVIPQNIKIQILTVTGKIVREITKDELGPLHIGNNITEFKWDGTDMYGSKLGNGVYLYRVITNLNGSSLEKFNVPTDKANNTDAYFKAGYGKMYLMR
ncbi:MAG: C25 family cysteine peptidase [Flavobacterium sp.]|nr:C25 family cysteine peptidase [Flavobacterium sp.]